MNKKSGRFTLVELVVVIAIMRIIAAVAVPRFMGFRNKAEERVCDANRKAVERIYSAFLVANDIDHEDSIFNQFLAENFDEVCSAGGFISDEDEEVKCSVYENGSEDNVDEPPGDEEPWL
ncbi:type II secretion system protein [Clostridiaceae bacterium 35-E11]